MFLDSLKSIIRRSIDYLKQQVCRRNQTYLSRTKNSSDLRSKKTLQNGRKHILYAEQRQYLITEIFFYSFVTKELQCVEEMSRAT